MPKRSKLQKEIRETWSDVTESLEDTRKDVGETLSNVKEKIEKRKWSPLEILLPLLVIPLLAAVWWLVRHPEERMEIEDEVKDRIRREPKPNDDLTEIEGIGPKTADVLRDAGIKSFSQLAKASDEELREILRDANMRSADPSTWPEQARLAASDDWDGLYAMRNELKAGRKTS
ncbi:MAG: DUF4332 domain-containing protein [Chloroflexota bacterium]|nr:MAG: DUF4332 domain-containing protein [Chloroflexota bacterium]